MIKALQDSSPGVVITRILLAALVVFGTYNPTGKSVYHWIIAQENMTDAWVILVAIIALILNIALLIAAWKALGILGTVIVLILFARQPLAAFFCFRTLIAQLFFYMKSLFANPYLLLTLATLAWGGNSVAGKLATVDWHPFTITATRWLLAIIMLLPFALPHLRKDKAILKTHWPILLALGAFGMALFNLCMYLALHHTSAINVSIEQAAMPMMIMIANFVFFSQRTGAMQIVGLVCSILGVLVTTTGGKPWTFFTNGLNFGDAIMLLACVFYAAYTIGLRWKPEVHWLSFIWMVSIGAFPMTVPFCLWEWQTHPFTMPPIKGWLIILYIVIFPTVVSQIFYARGVELIGGNRAGLFINLVPIFGSLLAITILGEKFHWYHGVGLTLVVGGIALAEKFAINT